jgi:hypothetical protein
MYQMITGIHIDLELNSKPDTKSGKYDYFLRIARGL